MKSNDFIKKQYEMPFAAIRRKGEAPFDNSFIRKPDNFREKQY